MKWPECVERWRGQGGCDAVSDYLWSMDSPSPYWRECRLAADCLEWLATAQPEPAEVCAPAEVVEAVREWRESYQVLRDDANKLGPRPFDGYQYNKLLRRLLELLDTATIRPAAEVREEAIADYQRVHEVCGPVHSLRSVEEVRAEARREALEETAREVREYRAMFNHGYANDDYNRGYQAGLDWAIRALAGKGEP